MMYETFYEKFLNFFTCIFRLPVFQGGDVSYRIPFRFGSSLHDLSRRKDVYSINKWWNFIRCGNLVWSSHRFSAIYRTIYDRVQFRHFHSNGNSDHLGTVLSSRNKMGSNWVIGGVRYNICSVDAKIPKIGNNSWDEFDRRSLNDLMYRLFHRTFFVDVVRVGENKGR